MKPLRVPHLVLRPLVLGAFAMFGACQDTATSTFKVADCTSHWHEVVTLDGLLPSAMAQAGGEVFAAAVTDLGPGIVAVPTKGGSPRVVATSAWMSAARVEGDALVFAQGQQFRRVPLAGGTPELLFDGNTAPPPSHVDTSTAQAITDEAFYWSEMNYDKEPGQDGSLVFSMPRQGGAARLLGAVPVFASTFVVAADGVLITGFDAAAVVPFDGSAPRMLNVAAPDWILGSDAAAVYVHGSDDQGVRDVRSVPTDGSQGRRLFFNGQPGASAGYVTALGPTSWVVLGRQTFDDGQRREVIWIVDGAGGARLAACAPGPISEIGGSDTSVVTPDGLFMAGASLADLNEDKVRWKLFRIDLN